MHRILGALLVAAAAAISFGHDDAPGDPAPGDPSISNPLEDGSELHPSEVS